MYSHPTPIREYASTIYSLRSGQFRGSFWNLFTEILINYYFELQRSVASATKITSSYFFKRFSWHGVKLKTWSQRSPYGNAPLPTPVMIIYRTTLTNVGFRMVFGDLRSLRNSDNSIFGRCRQRSSALFCCYSDGLSHWLRMTSPFLFEQSIFASSFLN